MWFTDWCWSLDCWVWMCDNYGNGEGACGNFCSKSTLSCFISGISFFELLLLYILKESSVWVEINRKAGPSPQIIGRHWWRMFPKCVCMRLPPSSHMEGRAAMSVALLFSGLGLEGGCTDRDRGWCTCGQPQPKVQKIISSVFQSGLVSTTVQVQKRTRTDPQMKGQTAY